MRHRPGISYIVATGLHASRDISHILYTKGRGERAFSPANLSRSISRALRFFKRQRSALAMPYSGACPPPLPRCASRLAIKLSSSSRCSVSSNW